MGLLREQTRRFWTATIFLALGPTLIGLTVFRIIHRSGVDVKYLYEREIAKSVGYEVQIERIEFLRPSSERLVNVEFMDPFTQEAFAFSPEIYLFHSHDSRLLKQFETAFEKRQGQTNVNVSDQEAPSLREAPSNAPISDYSQAFLAVVIPQLYVKEANLRDVKRTFLFQFESASGASEHPKNDGVVCLVADQVVFQVESEFQKTLDSRISDVPRKNQAAILESIRSSALLQPKTNKESERRFSPNDVVAFSSESPVIERLRALYVVDPNDHSRRKIDALFELSKMACTVPYYASIESSGHKGSRFELSTNGEAIPGSFIARFDPFFQFLDAQGWMEGTIIATSNLDLERESLGLSAAEVSVFSPSDQRVFLLKDFHLCQFDIERVTFDLDFSSLSGVVTNLSISEGIIQNGVILCNGRVEMKRGTVPRIFVHNLSQLDLIKIAPKRVESLRFINDALPFDALDLHFELRKEGIVLDSVHKGKLLAYYSRDNVKYGLYLANPKAGEEVETYDALISSLTSSETEKTIWTPLIKKAFVHLPVVKTAREKYERTQPRY